MTLDGVRARELPDLAPGFLDSAYFGPLPRRALDAGRRALLEQADPRALVYEEWRGRPDPVRAAAARLTGATPEDVAVVTSTTELVNRIAQGLRLGKGDRVAVVEGDYPAIVLPWTAREQDRVVLDRLRPPSRPPSAAWLDTALAPATRVLALTWVAFDTGARLDLAAVSELCRRRGIWLVVDATQGLGAIELDLRQLPGVSCLAVSCYKWLLGPYGTGFGVVRPELMEALAPRWVNWLAARNATKASEIVRITTDMLPGARALDRGQTPAFVTTAVLRASLELLLDLGPAAVAARGRALADRLVRALDRERFELATPEDARANIVSFRARDPAHGAALPERLRAAGLQASVREGKLRVAPHFFNEEAEIDRLLEALG